MNSGSSSFLLAMYRASRRMAHEEFWPWVFEELGRHLRSDSGFWLRTVITPSGPVMQDSHLDRQRPGRITTYLELELWREDPFLQQALSAAAPSMRMSVTDVPEGRLRTFLEQYEQEHVVGCMQIDPISSVVAGIAVFRRLRNDPYDAADQQFIEWVGPHIIDAWTHNWLLELNAAGAARHGLDIALGVLTASHMLTATDDRFAEFMNSEWPQWRGPSLPADVTSHLQRRADEPWIGRKTVARFEALRDGQWLIRIRLRHLLDGLSPRKREVARLFAEGANQTEVALQLALSTSTVNNYLVEVYRHLNVSDKAQLAVAVARMPP